MMLRMNCRVLLSISLPVFIQLCSCATGSNVVGGAAPPREIVLLRLVGFGPRPPASLEKNPEPAIESSSDKDAVPRDPKSIYELCFDPRVPSEKLPFVAAKLKSVRLASGAPGSEAEVESTLRAWKWTLYGSRPVLQIQAAALCFHERLPFADTAPQEATRDAEIKEQKPFDASNDYDRIPVREFVEDSRYQLALLPSIFELQKPPPPSKPEAENAPKILIRKKPLYTPQPHLPDHVKARYMNDLILGAFKMCLGTDGMVKSITPIIPIPEATRDVMRTLADWRFEPMTIPICFVQTLEFRVNW